MLLALIIVTYVLIGLVAGFFFGRQIWREGNYEGPSYKHYPPHDLGQSLWAFFGMLLAWPFFLIGFGVYLVIIGGAKIAKSLPVERLAHRLWD